MEIHGRLRHHDLHGHHDHQCILLRCDPLRCDHLLQCVPPHHGLLLHAHRGDQHLDGLDFLTHVIEQNM